MTAGPSRIGALLLYGLLAVAALLATVPGIAALPPVDRDESRYVQATKQMVETKDFVDIRFQDVPRYKKPIGIYWMQAAFVGLSGQGAAAPIWIYRLVSVLGALAAVLAAGWTGSRLFGREAGLVAGLAAAVLFGTAFEGRIAKTDALILGTVVLAQGALAQAYLASRRGAAVPAGLLWAFWLAQGIAILVKGPITPLVSLTTIVPLMYFDRDWRWPKSLRPLRGLALVVVIVLPWLALISWKSGGAFLQQSVGDDMLAKIGEGQESHWGPPGYYVLTYGLYMWPFGLLAMDAALRAMNRAKADPRLLFLLCWYVPFWLIFELISTKLPHYVLPAYPALALLIGWRLTEGRAGQAPLRLWQKAVWWLAAGGHVAVTVGLAGLAFAAPFHFGLGFSVWSAVAALGMLAAGWFALPRGTTSLRSVALATGGAIVAYTAMFAVVIPSLEPMWISPRIADAVRQHRPCETSVLASAGYHEPSLIFLVGTSTKLLDPAAAAQHLLADPACGLALVRDSERAGFDEALSRAGRSAQALRIIDGVNYSSGDAMTLTLYRLAGR